MFTEGFTNKGWCSLKTKYTNSTKAVDLCSTVAFYEVANEALGISASHSAASVIEATGYIEYHIVVLTNANHAAQLDRG